MKSPSKTKRSAPVVVALRACTPDLAEGLPDLALRGAARRDLAGLGAAVDLDQHAAHGRLGLRRELRRQRRGGRQHQVDRRQLDARQQQRLQVERRGDQRARPRHRGQRGARCRPGRTAGRCRTRRRPAAPAAPTIRGRSCAAPAPWRPGSGRPATGARAVRPAAGTAAATSPTSVSQRLACGCGAPVEPEVSRLTACSVARRCAAPVARAGVGDGARSRRGCSRHARRSRSRRVVDQRVGALAAAGAAAPACRAARRAAAGWSGRARSAAARPTAKA